MTLGKTVCRRVFLDLVGRRRRGEAATTGFLARVTCLSDGAFRGRTAFSLFARETELIRGFWTIGVGTSHFSRLGRGGSTTFCGTVASLARGEIVKVRSLARMKFRARRPYATTFRVSPLSYVRGMDWIVLEMRGSRTRFKHQSTTRITGPVISRRCPADSTK